MGINSFPASINFKPENFKKLNIDTSSSTLTKNTYVEILNYSGIGKLGDIHFIWNNTTIESKTYSLKITLDDVVVAWSVATQGSSSNFCRFGLSYKHKTTTDDVNAPYVFMIEQNSNTNSLYYADEVPFNTDGSAESVDDTSARAHNYYLEEPLYFNTSLKVEIFTDSTTGTGATSGSIEYYTRD